jgi:SAM-dependent methyltransferase
MPPSVALPVELPSAPPAPAPAEVQSAPPPSETPPVDELAALMQDILTSEKAKASPVNEDAPRVSREQWFADIFDESWLRTLPENTWARTRREVEFLWESLALRPGMQVLDLACGHGRHTLELAQRGIDMTGVDLSRPFLERAFREAERRQLGPRLMVGDMRDVDYDRGFEAAFCWGTSFGYFDDMTNYKVVTSLFRALRPGGRLVLETASRDFIAGHVPRRRWWDHAELVVMEEVDFDARTSRLHSLRTLVNERQRPWEQHISIRLYALHELCGMLTMAGFDVLEVSGDIAHRGMYLGDVNRQHVILAQRPVR